MTQKIKSDYRLQKNVANDWQVKKTINWYKNKILLKDLRTVDRMSGSSGSLGGHGSSDRFDSSAGESTGGRGSSTGASSNGVALVPKSLLRRPRLPVAAHLHTPTAPPGLNLERPILLYSSYASTKVSFCTT